MFSSHKIISEIRKKKHAMKMERHAGRLPSLNAVRAFEAVGRLLSFSAAASELNVTTSAVSHQIRALEDYLGLPLLRRINHQLALSPAGEKYFRQVSQALTQLSVATSGLLQSKGGRVLRVSVAPTIATWWLIPRLDRFAAAFPDISLEVSASMRRIDFALGEFDVAIRYGRRIESGLHAVQFGRNDVFPVCSPRLTKGEFPLRTAADLRHHTLIDTRDAGSAEEAVSEWAGWLSATGHPSVIGRRQLHLSPRGLMLQAVTQGLGVGLARTLMATCAMATRKLVCPFGPAIPLAAKYYVVCPEANANDPDVAAFCEWVLAEAKTSEALVKIPRA